MSSDKDMPHYTSDKETTVSDNVFDEEPVYRYTRFQALQDGVLVDLNQYIPVKESGYRYPVACTAAVFAIIERAVNSKEHHNDYSGVVWDILWMSRISPLKKWETGRLFQVIIKGDERRTIYNFKIEVGTGDDGEPVLTIMLPEED
jgi:hypothetical protein